MRATLAALLLVAATSPVRADAVDALREFAREAKTGRAAFTQMVTSPDGAKKKTSSGSFEFARAGGGEPGERRAQRERSPQELLHSPSSRCRAAMLMRNDVDV